MKYRTFLALAACAAFVLLAVRGYADNIKVDYNHHIKFANYHTYSWGRVRVSNQLDSGRIKQAVDSALQRAGWKQVATGGQITVMATDNIHNEKEAETYYSGMGDSWGMGWGWGGWGWGDGGFGPGGMESTSVTNVRKAHLIIDMFNSKTKKLLWRGVSRAELTNKPRVNRKRLYIDIADMFKPFPPKSKH
ncbi:MAG: DUF4136 domain-containing protein [Acidobacteriota bacterium]